MPRFQIATNQRSASPLVHEFFLDNTKTHFNLIMNPAYIAIDLGAGSGRVILGTLQGKLLKTEEIHRFNSRSYKVGSIDGHQTPNKDQEILKWDIHYILQEIMIGLQKVASQNLPIRSISADSWGVDYLWVDDKNDPLADPYHYRDLRTQQYFQKICERIGKDRIFEETGIQFMPINTLYQLAHDLEHHCELVDQAQCLLPIADYIHAVLSGVAASETSLASTTQLFNPRSLQWSEWLLGQLGLAKDKLPVVVASGTKLGTIQPKWSAHCGFSTEHPLPQVIAGCNHDTAAAVAAVPAQGKHWAFLSSGTWSLIGVERSSPVINSISQQLNFTNELGYHDTVRLLKNCAGLWILQQCQEYWEQQGVSTDYEELLKQAANATPFRSLIRPDAAQFLLPGNMPETIRAYCRDHGQPIPNSQGELTRCILESLALSYRMILDQLLRIIEEPIETLYIVGGGSRNTLLNQFTANATSLPTFAGPQEATAIGNLLIQAATMGDLSAPEKIREVVIHSFPPEAFAPQDTDQWSQAYSRFQLLTPGPATKP